MAKKKKDPVLYERLIKRFQSAREREEEGKAKGYGRTLEASLIRGESRIAGLRAETTEAVNHSTSVRDGPAIPAPEPGEMASTGLDPWDGPARDKEEGVQFWRAFLEDRFVHGRDTEFDYELVDEDESLDVLGSKDAEDKWFDEEEPSWVDDSEAPAKDAREGETGIQDF